jgi:mycothiol synthase
MKPPRKPATDHIWRPLRPTDPAAWSTLINTCSTADDTGEFYTPEILAEELEAPGLDLDRHTRTVAASDGTLVAYLVLAERPTTEPVHRMSVDAAVHPDHRGHGIGTRLLTWATEAAAAIHSEQNHPHPLQLDTQIPGTDKSGARLMAAQGYTPARYFTDMALPLNPPGRDPASDPDLPSPGGITLTPYDHSLHDEPARLLRNRAFADHWGSTEMDPDLWHHYKTRTAAFRPELSYLAVDTADGTPAGLVITHCYTEGEAWLDIVGTAREYRKRGVATALVRRAARAAAATGHHTATLCVDAASPTGADGLYHRLGFRPTHTTVRYRRDDITLNTPAIQGS